MPTRFIPILSATTSALATDTRPPPPNRYYRASEDNTDASVTETFHPHIRFVSGGVGVPTTPASRYLRSG